MNDSSSRQIFMLVVLTVSFLLALSAVPWSRLTGNTLKDFNLLGDLFPGKPAEQPIPELTVPELDDPEEGLAEGASGNEVTEDPNTGVAAADSVIPAEALAEAPVVDGLVMIESYLPDAAMFPRFKAALEKAAAAPVYVAVLGDSYIEGDIMSQDLRNLMQEKYGGSGVGHVALHSDFPGFRSSVRMKDSGWKLHDIRTMAARDSIRVLSCDYAVSEGASKTTFNGNAKSARTASWNRSSFFFIARDSGTVSLATDGGSRTFDVIPSGSVQCLEMTGTTTMFEVKTDIAGLKALGVRLDPASGIVVDCMSIRGNSGLPMRRLNAGLCREMAARADYSLIILEYGMNAVNADENDYTAYGVGIKKTIDKIKNVYSNADILVVGIGDRGTKQGAAVVSLPTCQAMVNVQRSTAAKAGVHFWDTRAAMGGDGAIADWRRRRLVNADYIHLNHDGGRELATLLYQAIDRSINE